MLPLLVLLVVGQTVTDVQPSYGNGPTEVTLEVHHTAGVVTLGVFVDGGLVKTDTVTTSPHFTVVDLGDTATHSICLRPNSNPSNDYCLQTAASAIADVLGHLALMHDLLKVATLGVGMALGVGLFRILILAKNQRSIW